MEEKQITFETFKLCKKKGFKPDMFLLTTQTMVQTWLREVHQIHSIAIPTYEYKNKLSWFYYVVDLKTGYAFITQTGNPYDDYYMALEISLQKSLEQLKNKSY